MINSLLIQPMLILFAILALGSWVGQLSIKGISLGSAGVLFVALIFGHFGYQVPKDIMELGLLLFVYAVGLQAGPRFFRTFRRHGIQFVVIAMTTVLAGGLATIAVAQVLHLPYELAAGLFTGALTCTPALASAIDVVERIAPGSSAAVSVGYGIAYPFSMVGVVFLIQFLSRVLRRDLRDEEASWSQEKQIEAPGLEARQFRIENPNCEGKQVKEINPDQMILANISRIKRGDRVMAAAPDMLVQQGDVVMAVVTRIRRQGLEITPTGRSSLELGDNIRVVGERSAVENFVKLIHGTPRKAEETSMLTFLAGLLLGILVGTISIPLPNGIEIKLGIAGGAFLVSLLVGHFGRIGPFHLRVPPAAKNITRELGLMLFLAGAGVSAGAHFVEVLQQQGSSLLLAGALVTILSVLAGLLLMDRVFRMNLLSTMGALCACMTNPPGLGAANAQTDTDLPTLSYASVYPVALIFKIILVQVLVEVLRRVL